MELNHSHQRKLDHPPNKPHHTPHKSCITHPTVLITNSSTPQYSPHRLSTIHSRPPIYSPQRFPSLTPLTPYESPHRIFHHLPHGASSLIQQTTHHTPETLSLTPFLTSLTPYHSPQGSLIPPLIPQIQSLNPQNP